MRGPDKRQALKELRTRGVPIECIIDVGILSQTAELMEVFPDKPHILFEPVKEFHDTIRKNYEKLDFTLVDAAASDKEGEDTLEVATIIEGKEISHSRLVGGDANTKAKRPVTTVTLDGYVSRHPLKKPYLLKLDVDGFEIPILKGSTAMLKDTSVVVIETPKGGLTQRIAFLEAAGFELFDLVEPCYYDKSFWQCDAIMIRREIHGQYFSKISENFSVAKYEMFQLK